MTPYVVSRVLEDDVILFEKLERLFIHLPEVDLGRNRAGEHISISCHALARAVAAHFPVTFQDGYYAGRYEHSWLLTRYRQIIDFYPVGCLGGPIMVAVGVYDLHELYKPTRLRKITHERISPFSNEFARHVVLVTAAVGRTIKEQKLFI